MKGAFPTGNLTSIVIPAFNQMKGATANVKLWDKRVLKTIDFNQPTANQINVFLRPYYKDSRIEPIVAHEVKALKRLAQYDMTPLVTGYGKNFIEMSYVGEDVKGDLSARQIDYVINVLREAGIVHNDLAYEGVLKNCTCNRGKLYLIDFQLASIDGNPPADLIQRTFWRPDYGSDEQQLRQWQRN